MTIVARPPARSISASGSRLIGWVRTVPGLARRHPALVLVLVLGLVVRALVVVGYPTAFYFPDGRAYVLNSLQWRPNFIRPFGYPLFLKPFVPGPFGAVAVAQHVLALGLAVAAYAFLVRRGARPWAAALALLPVLLDARQIAVEQYVAAETLFVLLAGAGLMTLAWRDRLGPVAAAAGGLLIGAAALTRTVGLPLVAVVLVYLLIRRVGWRPLAGFALSSAVLLGGYLVWYHHDRGVYAFSQYQGRTLQARVLSIADCDRIKLTDQQRTLCPSSPPSRRLQRPDGYIWSDRGPSHRLYPQLKYDPFLGEFAWTVIRQQPVDYALLVARETSWHFTFSPPLEQASRCINRSWVLPATPNAPCQATLYQVRTLRGTPDAGPQQATGLTTTLSRYSELMITPGPLLALGVVATLVAALWRPRRPGWRIAGDGVLFTGAGFTLIVVSVATSMYEMRYLLPALVLIPMGTALAVCRIRSVTAGRGDGAAHAG